MPVLSINLSDDVLAKLRARALRHGRSVEAEACDILARACAAADEPPMSVEELQAFIDELYGPEKPTNVVDDFIVERRREALKET